MKILIITPHFPYPLDSGGNNAQFLLIDNLRKLHKITLICTKASQINYVELCEIWPDIDIQVLRYIDELKSSEKSPIVKVLNKLKYIYFHPRASVRKLFKHSTIKSAGLDNNNKLSFPDRTKMQYMYFDQINVGKELVLFVNEIITQTQFDIVQIEFINLISLGLIIPDNVISILVHHELGFVRTSREISTLYDVNIYDNYLFDTSRIIEINYLNRFNAIITFSEIDKEHLTRYSNIPIFVSPFSVKNQLRIEQSDFVFENLIYLGGEDHYPNKDAVLWFIMNVLDTITNKYENVKLKIVGNWSIETINAFSENKYVEFLGYVDDLNVVMVNSLMIVPLRIGSGIRSKILDAFAMKIPVISTSIGIEGIPAIDGVHYFHAETANDYLKIIDKVIKDPTMISDMTERALIEIIPNYSIEKCCKIRNDVYEKMFQTKFELLK